MEATEKLMRNLTVLTSKSDQLKNIELLRIIRKEVNSIKKVTVVYVIFMKHLMLI